MRWLVGKTTADDYLFAEHASPLELLQNWPNSKYQALGNNSDTFARFIARTIGRDGYALDFEVRGNEFPAYVAYPGYTPTLR